MKTVHFFFTRWPVIAISAALTGMTLLPLGCGPAKPDVATYLVTVTNATPDQAAAARQFVAKLFSDLATQHGLVTEKPLPSDAVALYFPSATGLNLSLSALNGSEHNIIISIIPVALGRKDNAGCRAVIAAVDQVLRKNFDTRLVK